MDRPLPRFYDDDRTKLRLFYRPVEQLTQWVEIDLSNWQEEYAGMAYITFRAVNFAKQVPDALFVQLGEVTMRKGLERILIIPCLFHSTVHLK